MNRKWCIIQSLVFGCGVAGVTLGAESGFMKRLAERIAEADNIIAEYHVQQEPQLLREALDIVSSFTFDQRDRDWEEAYVGVVNAVIGIVEVCYQARDHEYGLESHTPIFLKVAPPVGSAPVVVSGMDPDHIEDPDARRLYIEAIEENRGRQDQFRKEMVLQRVLDRGLQEIRRRVELLPADTHARTSIQMNARRVGDKRLREILLSIVTDDESEPEVIQ